MIRYKKAIGIKTDLNGEIYLDTDLGQTWKTMPINGNTPVTDWSNLNSKRELQIHQRDMIKPIYDAFFPDMQDTFSYTLYKVYKKGEGYLGTSDVLLMRISKFNIWFLSTTEDTWIQEHKYLDFKLNVEDSIGSVLDYNTRKAIYDFSDSYRGIRKTSMQYSDEDYVTRGIYNG